jgi:hypothetical protein
MSYFGHMKQLSISILILLTGAFAFAQAPQGINYQAVVRDAGGNELVNQVVSLRMTILENNITTVYSENHLSVTNDFGLVNLVIGQGTATLGVFNNIDWSTGNHFAQMEVDVTGGSNYLLMGSQRLMSVPYALYAETSGGQGSPGPTGPAGANGNDGTNGSDGATGATGSTGADGNDGATGATGSTGANGSDGPTGATGPTGADGNDGTNGSDGATGAQGPTGAQGSSAGYGLVTDNQTWSQTIDELVSLTGLNGNSFFLECGHIKGQYQTDELFIYGINVQGDTIDVLVEEFVYGYCSAVTYCTPDQISFAPGFKESEVIRGGGFRIYSTKIIRKRNGGRLLRMSAKLCFSENVSRIEILMPWTPGPGHSSGYQSEGALYSTPGCY